MSDTKNQEPIDKEQLQRDVMTFLKNFSMTVTGYKLKLEDQLKDMSVLTKKDELFSSTVLTTLLTKQFCELYYDYRKETKASEDELNAIVQIWDAVKALHETLREAIKGEVNVAALEAQKAEYLRVYDLISPYLVKVEDPLFV